VFLVLTVLFCTLFVVGLMILRVTNRLVKIEEGFTHSKDLEHFIESGIFVEHGMVRAGDNKAVRAQSKKSSTFIGCIS